MGPWLRLASIQGKRTITLRKVRETTCDQGLRTRAPGSWGQMDQIAINQRKGRAYQELPSPGYTIGFHGEGRTTALSKKFRRKPLRFSKGKCICISTTVVMSILMQECLCNKLRITCI